MARTVEQIERDLASLRQAVGAIALDFQKNYARYCEQLGQAVRQQLILASYHLCTQGYPERFLKLSLNQRQELQQGLLKLARQTQSRLATQSQDDELETAEPKLTDETNSLENFLVLDDTDQVLITELSNANQGLDDDRDTPRLQIEQVETPQQLSDWLEQCEEAIAETLQEVSQGANRLLQRADVLPGKLPEPILDVAAKSGLATEATSGIPNLLNLLVEIESDEDEDEPAPSVTHIMAIKLRLSEIEFVDANLSAMRMNLRELLARLSQLKREYQKRQQELAIAQAEAAWRSSWYE
jgi:Spy/CpxP family protein refolding chaperone